MSSQKLIVTVPAPPSVQQSGVKELQIPYTQDHHHLPIEQILASPFATHDRSFHDFALRSNAAASIDPTGRNWAYLVQGGNRFMYLSSARFIVCKVMDTFMAAADVISGGKIEVDLSKVLVGTTLTVKWRSKPVFVRHRSPKEIAAAKADDDALMRDPQPDFLRTKSPEWLVLMAACTHLGCVPLAGAGNYGGWFCPCHGSHYDTSGRVRAGPAPLNLQLPEPMQIVGNTLILG